MTLATDLLLDIATEKNGYSIGKPWRFSQFSLAAIIPIVRETEAERNYRLLSEVGKDVLIKDSGAINLVEITNRGTLPVLLKAGEMVAGATQTRVLVLSQVLMAGEKVEADCVCVHASQGIRAGQLVNVSGYSPSAVRDRVYSGWESQGGADIGTPAFSYTSALQQDVWGEVKAHSRGLADRTANFVALASSGQLGDAVNDAAIPHGTFRTSADDLAGRVHESKEKFEAVLKQMPKVENQVGICLIDLSGFDTLESFEHPASWEALREKILEAESAKIGDVTDQDGVFEFKAGKAKATIRRILTSQFEEAVTVEKANTMTFLLQGSKITGEVVTLYGQQIHCAFVRKA